MARSTARKRALNTLYEADEKDADILNLLSERITVPGAETPLPAYAIQIVRGVAQHYKHIDGMINEHASWHLSRMAVIDRNILRIAVWEIVYNEDTPAPVAIDEAMKLSKKYSDADSPAFIHAVLSAIASDPNDQPEGDDESQRSMGLSKSNHRADKVDKKETVSTSLVGTRESLIPVAERRRRKALTCIERHRLLKRRREGARLERPVTKRIHQAERLLARATILEHRHVTAK